MPCQATYGRLRRSLERSKRLSSADEPTLEIGSRNGETDPKQPLRLPEADVHTSDFTLLSVTAQLAWDPGVPTVAAYLTA